MMIFFIANQIKYQQNRMYFMASRLELHGIVSGVAIVNDFPVFRVADNEVGCNTRTLLRKGFPVSALKCVELNGVCIREVLHAIIAIFRLRNWSSRFLESVRYRIHRFRLGLRCRGC